MARMRFNHMELTLPIGTLTGERREEIKSFYGDVLGWTTADIPLLGQSTYFMAPDDGQFLLLAESEKPMQSPGYDHLGLLLDTRAEVDEVLEQCKKFAARDDRMKIKEYDDLVQGPVTVKAFYVKYLLPIYFDIQCLEWEAGSAPEKSWRWC
jgi:predicted enzyme related to lactoylglutathione lyase